MVLDLPSNILLIAAHSDDEVLMAGGLLIKNKTKGGQNNILYFTKGVGARENIDIKDEIKREYEAKKSAEILGAEIKYFGTFPDNQLDNVPLLNLIKIVESFIEELQPSIIITHSQDELNIDHQIIGRAVITAARPSNKLKNTSILLGNVPSSKEWHINQSSMKNNLYVNIEKEKDLKYEALKSYESEIRYPPNPRSLELIKIKDQLVGAEAGLNYAESFVLFRGII